MAEGQGRRWLRCGCLGCLGLVGLGLLSAGLVAGIAWYRAAHERVEERAVEADLAGPAAGGAAGERGGAIAAAPRRVVLVLRNVSARIVPVAAGEPLRVDGSFDANSYELTQDDSRGPDGTTVHEIRFRRTRDSWVTTLKEMFSGSWPKLDVRLPRDVPIALQMEVYEGDAEVDLGGLWLTEVDLRVERGGLDADCGEPLREPVERFAIRVSMGGFSAARLGNASPRRLDVEGSMGGFDVDLRGAWRADADIDIQSRMGGASVRLPRDVRIVGLDVGSMTPANDEVARPTLRFTTSSQMSGVEFLP